MELIEFNKKNKMLKVFGKRIGVSLYEEEFKKSQCLHKLLKCIFAGREMNAYFIIDKYRKQC